jgi:AcrR family transcriptional regulator
MPAMPAAPADGERSRLGLSRTRILDAALALLDRDGLQAFSMRRLAEELGVGTMTVYGYFRGKDELLDSVVAAAAQRIGSEPSVGPWKGQLRELFVRVHEGHVEHPAIVELRLRRPLISPGALTLTERAMAVLLDAGFGERDAARAYRALYLYTFGFSAFAPATRAAADQAETVRAFAEISTDTHPALVTASEEAAEAMGDQTVFEFGLDRLLDGLEAITPTRARPRP